MSRLLVFPLIATAVLSTLVGAVITLLVTRDVEGGELRDIPVFVGDMAFNEPNNSGYRPDFQPSWQSSDFTIDTDGRFSGRFNLRYDGDSTGLPILADVIFVQAIAAESSESDVGTVPLSPVTGIQCQSPLATARSAMAGAHSSLPRWSGRASDYSACLSP
jgi:hypothetical protein